MANVAEQLGAVTATLRAARALSGLGVRQVARAGFVSPGTVRNLEAGRREPELRQTGRVAYALGLRVEFLPNEGPARPTPYRELRLEEVWFLPLAFRQPVPPSADVDSAVWFWLRVMAAQASWHRRQRGWSDERAARAWGLSPKTLRRLQYGEGWPSLASLATVAADLGASVVLSPITADWPPMPWEYAPSTG